MSRPFLAATEESRLALVQTPLRSDPRPLSGLFQQLVVLVRSAMLYEKVLVREPETGDGPVGRRYEALAAQGRQALDTIGDHSDKLSDQGRLVIAEAEQLLRREGVVAGRRSGLRSR